MALEVQIKIKQLCLTTTNKTPAVEDFTPLMLYSSSASKKIDFIALIEYLLKRDDSFIQA